MRPFCVKSLNFTEKLYSFVPNLVIRLWNGFVVECVCVWGVTKFFLKWHAHHLETFHLHRTMLWIQKNNQSNRRLIIYELQLLLEKCIPSISQITMSIVSLEMVVSLLQVTSVAIILRATQNMIGDQRPRFPLSLTLPLSGREQSYVMPTAIMASLHPSKFTYADNATTISNFGWMAQMWVQLPVRCIMYDVKTMIL